MTQPESIARTINGREVTLTESERQRCEVWTRVMGYYRPVDNFNIGKKQEFHDRRFYKEK